MLFRIRHATRFRYEQPARESHNEVRLTPYDDAGQRCVAFDLRVAPDGSVFSFDDYFGNRVHSISIHPPHPTLSIVATSLVERTEDCVEQPVTVAFQRFLEQDEARTREHCEFLAESRYVPFSPRLRKFFWMARPGRSEDVAAYVMRMVYFIRDQFEYEPGATHVHSSLDEILTAGGGVCQDFAHLTLGVFRLAGVPARYVSGYLAPPESLSGSVELQEQFSHAWVEALVPGQGWMGLDPTHRCRIGLRHIKLASGRDYADASPIRGVDRSEGGRNTMSVELEVRAADPNAASSGQSQQ